MRLVFFHVSIIPLIGEIVKNVMPVAYKKCAAGISLLVSVSGKLLGTRIAGKILKWQPGEASLIGWLLQTEALIMIIFSNVLLDKGIITNATFTALLLMAVASTMLTVPVVAPKLERMKEIIFRSK